MHGINNFWMRGLMLVALFVVTTVVWSLVWAVD
jgi:hypothetical protein